MGYWSTLQLWSRSDSFLGSDSIFHQMSWVTEKYTATSRTIFCLSLSVFIFRHSTCCISLCLMVINSRSKGLSNVWSWSTQFLSSPFQNAMNFWWLCRVGLNISKMLVVPNSVITGDGAAVGWNTDMPHIVDEGKNSSVLFQAIFGDVHSSSWWCKFLCEVQCCDPRCIWDLCKFYIWSDSNNVCWPEWHPPWSHSQ